MGKPKTKVEIVRVSGPLAPYAGEVESDLAGRGYTPWTRAAHLRAMAHLSEWLQARQLGAADLSRQRIEQYREHRRGRGYTGFCSRRSLTPMLGVLASLGLLPDEEPPALVSPADLLLDGFSSYLREERGLTACTTQAYVARARRFLAEHSDDGDLRGLTPVAVSAAVLRESAAVSAGSVQYFVAALRALLRYGHVAGLIDADLSGAALPVTGRRRSSLPEGISPGGGAGVAGFV